MTSIYLRYGKRVVVAFIRCLQKFVWIEEPQNQHRVSKAKMCNFLHAHNNLYVVLRSD